MIINSLLISKSVFIGFVVLAATEVQVCTLAQQPPHNTALSRKMKPILYTDIGHGVTIIGHFGHPLGDYLVLKGKRIGGEIKRKKTGHGNFLVEQVNGTTLPSPVEWWDDKVATIPTGTYGIIEGYETGEMTGVPQKASHRAGIRPSQVAWQFSVQFVTIKVMPVR